MEKYKTVRNYSSCEIVEKKSRFIGYVCPVKTEKEALEFISKISKKHWDATHNVYAYKVNEGNISRCSDDGEPAKTAGAPILDVIEKEELIDLCVVVTRYFGGTLLGTGGLVKAYSKAGKDVINVSGIVTKQLSIKFAISIPYHLLGKYENEFKNHDVIILEKEFSETVDLLGICKEEKYDILNKRISEISGGQFLLIETEKLFYGF